MPGLPRGPVYTWRVCVFPFWGAATCIVFGLSSLLAPACARAFWLHTRWISWRILHAVKGVLKFAGSRVRTCLTFRVACVREIWPTDPHARFFLASRQNTLFFFFLRFNLGEILLSPSYLGFVWRVGKSVWWQKW